MGDPSHPVPSDGAEELEGILQVDADEEAGKSRVIVGGGADALAAYVPPTALPKKSNAKAIDVEKVQLNIGPAPQAAQEMRKLPTGRQEDPTARMVLRPEDLARLAAAGEMPPEAARPATPSGDGSPWVSPTASATDRDALPSASYSPHAQPPEAPKKSRAPVAVLGGFAVAAVVFVAWFAMSGPKAKPGTAAAPSAAAATAQAAPAAEPPAAPDPATQAAAPAPSAEPAPSATEEPVAAAPPPVQPAAATPPPYPPGTGFRAPPFAGAKKPAPWAPKPKAPKDGKYMPNGI